MPRINAFSRNVNSNLKENSTSILEREIKLKILEIKHSGDKDKVLKDKGGNQDYLPFC